MHRRCFLRSLAAAQAAGLVRMPLVFTTEAFAQQRGGIASADPFKPSEPANSPLGDGKGIHPGRVVWVRDANATSWDGATGHWWDDAYTDQKLVHGMTSRMVLGLTGKKNEKQAWDALFRSFNDTHKLGNSGYRPGETIAIKINCNQDRSRSGEFPHPPRRRLREAAPIRQAASERLAQPSRRGGPGDATDRKGGGARRRHHAVRCRRHAQRRPTHLPAGFGPIPIPNSRQ